MMMLNSYFLKLNLLFLLQDFFLRFQIIFNLPVEILGVLTFY